ncbi:COG4705 family protein [Flavobacterium sp. XGLA_31]|uniref:COG4705 family protein n=1 Tax=Flavobacterium sp. XGLA_31 TaxID=3447666 RepID=UPI003F37616A
MKKLPELTALFWLTKIIATTLGETAGDLVSITLHVGYALSSLLLFGCFLVLLAIQLFSKKYTPWIYWLVVLATSTSGTTLSDYMDRTLELGYATGSLCIATLLCVVLLVWKFSEKSLSVTQITRRSTEMFYWTAILVSNTLGTALGDFLADDSGLGFAGGAALIGLALGIVLLVHYSTKISGVILFWLAFVLTRPFGATFGDVLTKSADKGGLNLGTKGTSLLLFVLLLIVVGYETQILKKNNKKEPAGG